MGHRIRLGMVGGGRDAFIGGVHRIASRIDDRYELVAGAFSSTPEKSKASATDLGIAPDRAYGDFTEMAKREARLKNGIEAVAIVTPNHMHYPVAREFLKRGIHVICDKPLTSTLADAKKLARAAALSDALFVLTHNYTGYPMIRQARDMVANGEIGDIRLVQVEYAQDWLSDKLEDTGQKQAGWRTDPERSGAGGSTGDIGTHAFNLASFVSGLELESLCADLDSFVEGRRVDDNGHVLMRYKGGAKGMLWCSQVAPGQRERAEAANIRLEGRARMGAGGSELSVVHPARRAEAVTYQKRRRRDRRQPTRQPHPRRPPRRLSRRVREHLQRSRRSNPGKAGGRTRSARGHLSRYRGRTERRRLRDSLCGLVEARRKLGQVRQLRENVSLSNPASNPDAGVLRSSAAARCIRSEDRPVDVRISGD